MNVREKAIGLLHKSQRFLPTDMYYVASGSVWLFIGKVSVLISSLIVTVAFANLIPKEVYGAYQYVVSAVAALSLFALPGMDNALIRSVARGKHSTLLPATRTKVLFSLIGSGIIAIAALWYLAHTNILLAGAFLVAAAFFPLVSPLSTSHSFWQGQKNFKYQNSYIAFFNLGHAAVLTTTLFFTDSLIAIIAAYFIPRSLMQISFYLFTKRFAQEGGVDKEAIPYGKRLSFLQGINTLSNYIDKVIVWHFLGPIQVAVYSLAQMPMQRLKRFLPISELALPKLSQEGHPDRKRGLFIKFWIILAVTLVFVGILVVSLPTIYRIFLSPYVESIPYAQVLTLMLLGGPFLLFKTALVAEGKIRELYLIDSIAPSIRILLFLVLTPIYGIWGTVVSVIATEILAALTTAFLFNKAAYVTN